MFRIRKSFKAIFSSAIIAFAFIMVISSCKKSSSSNSNSAFIGTYYGTLTTSGIYTSADTIVITAGSNSSSIVMNSRTAAGSVYNVNASVNDKSITMSSQQVTVPSLSETFTVTGTGNLNGSTLQLNMVFVNASSVSYNLNFTGTKQ